MTLECADLHYRGSAMSQWVQHISGQGEKYQVSEKEIPDWAYPVELSLLTGPRFLYLPKSEYRLCDPPEQWVDVTKRCKVNNYGTLVHINGEDHSINGVVMNVQEGYRLRKVELKNASTGAWQPAFLVERKQL